MSELPPNTDSLAEQEDVFIPGMEPSREAIEHAAQGDNTAYHDDLEHAEGNPHEQATAADASVGGLRRVIAKIKLQRVESLLKPYDESAEISPHTIRSNDRKKSKIGRYGASNLGIVATYRTKDEGQISVQNSSAGRTYRSNTRKINKTISKVVGTDDHRQRLESKREELRSKLGTPISNPEQSVQQAAGRPSDRSLERARGGMSASQKAYLELLNKSKTHAVLDESVLEDTFGKITSSNSRVVRFVAEKLVRDGVVDEDGNVLMTEDEIDAMKADNNRFVDRKEERPESVAELQTDTPLAARAHELFERADTFANKVVEADESDRSDEEKRTAAHHAIWRDFLYDVDTADRPALLVYFTRFLDQSNGLTQPVEEMDPRTLYKEAETIVEILLVDEDFNDPALPTKYENLLMKVWTNFAGLAPADKRDMVVSQFQQQRQDIVIKSKSKQTPRRNRRAEVEESPEFTTEERKELRKLSEKVSDEIRSKVRMEKLNQGLIETEKLPEDEFNSIVNEARTRIYKEEFGDNLSEEDVHQIARRISRALKN